MNQGFKRSSKWRTNCPKSLPENPQVSIMTSIYEKKIAEVWPIHPEQMSLYYFIILRKKRDSNIGAFLWNLWNFQEQWWLLLKTCNILLRNKKLCRARISHLQRHAFTLAFILNSVMRHESRAWRGVTFFYQMIYTIYKQHGRLTKM